MPSCVYKRTPKSLEERFWAKVHNTDSCWLWTGATMKVRGYGAIKIPLGNKKSTRLAHRQSKEWNLGYKIDDDIVLMHTCDTPNCVNPPHLAVGIQADNLKDCIDKGRHGIRWSAGGTSSRGAY